MEDFNPGEELRKLLKEIYPPDPPQHTSFPTRLDDALVGDGELANLIYASSINYITRRLITTAEYFRRKFEDRGESTLIKAIRKFLTDHTRIPGDKVEKALALLLECTRINKNKSLTMAQGRAKTTVSGRKFEPQCYICGITINLSEQNQYNSASMDHIWPNSLGGSNADFNLKIACRNCNSTRSDFIDSSDFHYERICLISDKGTGNFSTELSRVNEIALWAKNSYKCKRCDKPAAYVGRLEFSRRNPEDSWHYLNIDAYCMQHCPDIS